MLYELLQVSLCDLICSRSYDFVFWTFNKPKLTCAEGIKSGFITLKECSSQVLEGRRYCKILVWSIPCLTLWMLPVLFRFCYSALTSKSTSFIKLNKNSSKKVGCLRSICMDFVRFEFEKVKTNLKISFFFLSKSFVDPVPIIGKSILTTALSPFLHSMVSKILCGKRIGFITLLKNKITKNHRLLLLSERVLGVNYVLCIMKFE